MNTKTKSMFNPITIAIITLVSVIAANMGAWFIYCQGLNISFIEQISQPSYIITIAIVSIVFAAAAFMKAKEED